MTQDREEILRELERLAGRAAEYFDPVLSFVPVTAHHLVLREENLLILGQRGAGKTALFRLIDRLRDSAELRRFFQDDAIPEAIWVDAFADQTGHPTLTHIGEFARDRDMRALRAFWIGHLLRRLRQVLPDLHPLIDLPAPLLQTDEQDPHAWMKEAPDHLAQMAALLERVEEALAARGQMVFASYDGLDRLGEGDRRIRTQVLVPLLSLWLTMTSRYRFLRGKIFLREDLMDEAELGFPDASKLRPRSTTLRWDVSDLYRAVVRHMAATGSVLQGWLRGLGILPDAEGEYGYIPGEMKEAAQQLLAEHLAGPVLGAGITKDITSRWLVRRLADGKGQIMPRTLLCLIGHAAVHARRGGYVASGRLLSETDLLAGLRRASQERLNEMKEDYPIIRRMENLEGRRLPMQRKALLGFLEKEVPAEPSSIPPDPKVILEELKRIGALIERSDRLLDVPDIYLLGLGIKRKGTGEGDTAPALPQYAAKLGQGRTLLERAWAHTGAIGQGLYQQAAARFEEAARLDPESDEAHALLGRALVEQAASLPTAQAAPLLHRARESLRRAIEINPESAEAWHEQAALFIDEACRDAEQFEAILQDAEDCCAKARRFAPDAVWARLRWAYVHWLLSRVHASDIAARHLAEAEKLVHFALNLSQRDPWVLTLQGLIQFEQAIGRSKDEVRDALRPFQLAYERAPDQASVLNHWAWSLLRYALMLDRAEQERRFEQANERFRWALIHDPAAPSALSGLAYLELRRSAALQPAKLDALREQLHAAEAVSPYDAVYPLAYLYARAGDAALSRSYLEQSRRFGTLPPPDVLAREPAFSSFG
jgi:tetratricopeptide (TPR) repeat protein